MARLAIIKLPENPAKADEIRCLKEIAESIPQDTYLSSLFTKSFVDQLEQGILDDHSLDVGDELRDLRAGKMQAEFKFQETKKAADHLNGQLEHVQQKWIDAENQILLQNAELKELRELRDSFEEVRADKDEQLRLMQTRLEAADRIIGELRAGGERAQNVEAMMAYFGWTQ